MDRLVESHFTRARKYRYYFVTQKEIQSIFGVKGWISKASPEYYSQGDGSEYGLMLETHEDVPELDDNQKVG